MASRSPKYFDRTSVSRGCGACGYPMGGLGQLGEEIRHCLGSHRLQKIGIDHDWRREAAGAEALDFDHGEPAVIGRDAEVTTPRVLEERVHHLFGAAHVAG